MRTDRASSCPGVHLYAMMSPMKYELETIPVWDGVKSGCECFLCNLMEDAQSHYVDFYLGSSVMNPETRVRVNNYGFCPEHFSQLAQRGKPQALALLCDTYLARSRELFSPAFKDIASAKPGRKSAAAVDAYVKADEQREHGCLICTQMQERIDRYCFTTAYLWGKDPEFRTALENSKGVCLYHLRDLLLRSQDALDPKTSAEFCAAMVSLMEKNLQRTADDVLWMTQKYKSENIDKPWNGCEDAQKRAVYKMIGQGRVIDPLAKMPK